MTAPEGRGILPGLFVGTVVGGLVGAGVGYLVSLHPNAPGPPMPWVFAGVVGGLLGPVVAWWGAIGLQLRGDDDFDSAAGLSFVVALLGGGLGGVVGGSIDGGTWDLLFGGLSGLAVGAGVGFMVLLAGKLVGRFLLRFGGPAVLLGLAGGGAAAVGAGLFQASTGPDSWALFVPLRLLAGGVGGLAGTAVAGRVGDLPRRGSLACLGLAILLAVGLAGYFVSQSPLLASLGPSGRVASAGLSPDGARVLLAVEAKAPDPSGNAVRLIDAATGVTTRSFPCLAWIAHGWDCAGPSSVA